jgi:cellobiose phosphorylase
MLCSRACKTDAQVGAALGALKKYWDELLGRFHVETATRSSTAW